MLLGFWPYGTFPCLCMLSVFVIVFLWTRYISLGSMLAAATFPVSYLAMAVTLRWGPFASQWPLTVFSLSVFLLVVYKHRTNIARLRAGTENRAVRRSDDDATA